MKFKNHSHIFVKDREKKYQITHLNYGVAVHHYKFYSKY